MRLHYIGASWLPGIPAADFETDEQPVIEYCLASGLYVEGADEGEAGSSPLSDELQKLHDELAAMPDGPEKTARTLELFGTSGRVPPEQAAEASARPEAAESATEGATVADSHEQAAGSTPAAAEVGSDVDLAAKPAAPEPEAATGGNPGADPAGGAQEE